MPPVPSLFRRMANSLTLLRGPEADALTAPISAFESETQAVIVRTTPASEHAVLHVLAGMVLLSIILMAVVKLDRVVTSIGKIVPTRGELYIQPLDRAIVREIKVHIGDVVKKGQVLAELDPTFAKADVEQYRQHLATDRAIVARLEAELADRPYTGGATREEQLQFSIWQQRQTELSHTKADYDARIRSAEATIKKAQQDIAQYSQNASIATNIEGMESTLEQRGYGSKLKRLNAQSSRVELQRLLNESQNTLVGAQHDLDALKAQRQVALSKWQDDIGTLLATTRDDMNQAEQALSKAQKVSDLVMLEAPEDAVVLDVGNASIGSVIDLNTQLIKPLFTLVPLNGPVEAEVRIKSSDIGFTDVGDPVRLKLEAYPFIRHGTMLGKIITLSEGSFTTDENLQPTAPYFKARVRVERSELHNVPSTFRLIPGMTLAGDILIGKRTILSYLVEGGLRTASEAMREP